MDQSYLDVVVSSSHEGSRADTSNSNANSGCNNSSDDLSEFESDLMKKVKVIVSAAAAGMTFDFGPSTIGKGWIQMMEGLGYFGKGSAWAPSSESVPEPRVDEVVVFKDLFAARLHMPSHTTLAYILQKFHVQLHQLMSNTIVQLSKYL
jgi:hypothetical protein